MGASPQDKVAYWRTTWIDQYEGVPDHYYISPHGVYGSGATPEDAVRAAIDQHNNWTVAWQLTFVVDPYPYNFDAIGNYLLAKCRMRGVDSPYNQEVQARGYFSAKTQGKPCTGVGNPVNYATGAKFQAEVDYRSASAHPLEWVRFYSSPLAGLSSRVGSGWRTNYDRSLAQLLSGVWSAYRPDGKILAFRAGSNGLYTADADVDDTLERLADAAGNTSGWRYTDTDGTVEAYDATGRLLSITPRGGWTQAMAYDTQGRLAQISDWTGASLTLAYDAQNRVASVTDPAGGTIRYTYDAINRLATVAYQDGTSKTYLYGEKGNTANANQPALLTGIVDENGIRYATFKYDASGRAVSTEHAGGIDRHQVAITFDLFGQPASSSITDPLGTVRVHSLKTVQGVSRDTSVSQPGGSGCAAASSATAYDAAGNAVSRRDFNGNLSCHAYGSRNLEAVRVEGVTGGACPSGLATYAPKPGERKTVFAWHPAFRLPARIDEAGRSTAFDYDTAGNLLKKTVTDTATGQARAWSWTYNAQGQVLSEDGPRTDLDDTTRYEYYADAASTHRPGDLWKVTNALGHATTYAAYDAHGRPTRIEDPNGLAVTLAYDARGRLASKAVDGNATRYGYDPVGNLVRLTLPTGVFYTYAYDPAHRLTAITDGLGGRIEYTLDAAGHRVKEDIFEAGGGLVKTHRWQYDALGRLAQDIGAYNQTTGYEYDAGGNLTRQTDPEGHATLYAYDALGRLTRQTDALQGATRFDYDALGRLARATDALGHATQYAHDAFGGLTRQDSPDTGATRYAYDSAGNLSQKTDAAGVTAAYTYDALDRLTAIDYPGTDADVAYTYDGQPGDSPPQKGRLTAARRGENSSRATAIRIDFYRYDRRGNLVSDHAVNQFRWEGLLQRPFTFIGYSYDGDGQLAAINTLYPPKRIQYRRDAAGQVDQVTVYDHARAAAPLATGIRHLPFGPVKSLTYGNGLRLERRHDLDYRRAAQAVGTVQSLAYAYGPAGRLQSATDALDPANNESYAYDALGRLVAAQGRHGSLAYAYDAVGNRVADWRGGAETRYTYDPAGQRLLSLSGARADTLAYDANGNATLAGGTELAYGPDQRLAAARQNGADAARHAYDAFGRRAAKAAPGARVAAYAYDLEGRLLDDRAAAALHAWLDGEPLARIPYAGMAGALYYHNTPSGTPHTATGQDGQVAWKANAEPFGRMSPEGPAVQNLRFPGQWFDAETGLHYNMARYYDASTGRYLQADPIGLGGGVNLYGYVEGDPLNYIDPLGLWSCKNENVDPTGVPKSSAEGAAAWAQYQYEQDNKDYTLDSKQCGGKGEWKCNCFVADAYRKGGGLKLNQLPRSYVNGKPTRNYARANDYADKQNNKGVLGEGDGSIGNIVAWPASSGSGHTGIIGCDGKIYSATRDGVSQWNRDFSWEQFSRYYWYNREKIYRSCCGGNQK